MGELVNGCQADLSVSLRLAFPCLELIEELTDTCDNDIEPSPRPMGSSQSIGDGVVLI